MHSWRPGLRSFARSLGPLEQLGNLIGMAVRKQASERASERMKKRKQESGATLQQAHESGQTKVSPVQVQLVDRARRAATKPQKGVSARRANLVFSPAS